MAGRTFGFILRIGISLAILLLSSCARKTDGTRVQTYTDDELRQLRTEFDIYENILGRHDSFSLSAVDSILPLAKKILDYPQDALTEEQSHKQARHYATCAHLYIAKDDLGNAFNVLDKGVTLYNGSRFKEAYVHISTSLASLYFNYAMYRQANQYADYAIEAATPIRDSVLLTKAYITKAWIMDRIDNEDSSKVAAYKYSNLARMYLPAGIPHLEYALEAYAGNIYSTDPDSAAIEIGRLKRIWSKYGDKYAGKEGMSYIPYNIGRAYATLGNIEVAIKYFDKALSMVEQEPLIIRNEVYSGILQKYLEFSIEDRIMDIVPEWYATTKYRHQMVSERGMTYWNAKFESERQNYKLQMAENTILRSRILHLIISGIVIILLIAVTYLLYKLKISRNKQRAIYEEYQRRLRLWELSMNHKDFEAGNTAVVDYGKDNEVIEENRGTEENGENDREYNDIEETGTLNEIYERVKDVMENLKPYLNPNFTLLELSRMVYCNRSQLSASINKYYGTNFPTMVSEYRINYFIGQMKKIQYSKLDDMWPKAGFTSRSSFFRQFKMITNLSPSQYFEEMSKHTVK